MRSYETYIVILVSGNYHWRKGNIYEQRRHLASQDGLPFLLYFVFKRLVLKNVVYIFSFSLLF